MSKDNGGPAFPGTQYAAGISPSGHSDGMTLRDYFAAKATDGDIQEIIRRQLELDPLSAPVRRQVARFIHADAMIEARKA